MGKLTTARRVLWVLHRCLIACFFLLPILGDELAAQLGNPGSAALVILKAWGYMVCTSLSGAGLLLALCLSSLKIASFWSNVLVALVLLATFCGSGFVFIAIHTNGMPTIFRELFPLQIVMSFALNFVILYVIGVKGAKPSGRLAGTALAR